MKGKFTNKDPIKIWESYLCTNSTEMLIDLIRNKSLAAILALYDIQLSEKELQVNITKPEFEGDYTVVLFSLVK